MKTTPFTSRAIRACALALGAVAVAGLAACAAPAAPPEPLVATAAVAEPATAEPVAAEPVAPALPAVADPSVPVSIVVRDFAYDTSAITFTTGVTYHLIITNTGAISHELRVLARGESQMMMDMGIAEHMDMGHGHEHASELLYVGGEELPPGATIERTLAFERPGAYELGCHLPAHLESGMLLPIDVVGDDLEPVSAEDITVDTESMHDMPCHAMGTTIMGDCTPEDIERLKREILSPAGPEGASDDG